MSTLYMTIGPPAAGKTTFVSWQLVGKRLVGATDVLNPDGLLYVKGEYRWSGAAVARAWRACHADFAKLLQSGRPLVVDATFAYREWRRPFVEAARQAGYRVVAVLFEVPPELLIERDRGREAEGKRVGVNIIHRFYTGLEPPDVEAEGFDAVWHVGADGECPELLEELATR